MSSTSKEVAVDASGGAQSSRRRRRGPRGPRPAKKVDGAVESWIADKEPVERSDRASKILPTVPVPVEMIGTVVKGMICDIISRKRASKFGFIYVGEGVEFSRGETPRIYFNFKDYEEEGFPPRKGYLVEFVCAKDDKDRVYADKIKLTPTGLEEATIREERIKSGGGGGNGAESKRDAAPRAEKAERAEDGGKKSERKKRTRKAGEERIIPLSVTCDGKQGEEKFVQAKLSQSIGKLKHAATQEFDAPHSFNVFCKISPENPEGVLLTKPLLKELRDNDPIHLKAGGLPEDGRKNA